MPRKPNRYNGGRRKSEKRKRDRVSQLSEQSLDKAVSGGVGTSSDTHSIGSEIKNQPTVVGAHDLQEQSIIICPDADTIVSIPEECSLPDPEPNESSIQGGQNSSEKMHEGYNRSRMSIDGRNVPDIGRGIQSADEQDSSDGDSAIQTVSSEEIQR
ncbi:MAG: hypothetical protein GY861_15440, partial [bacterium]|nr:hypothetical protein [bacterium]